MQTTGTAVVAGGAGFVGSHLCDALLERGAKVICIDSFQTGRAQNVAALQNHPRFSLITADICEITDLPGRIDRVYNLACPASPPHYQADPVRTMMTCVVGTERLLSLAERHGARFLQASTSEVYGDPEAHPQHEDYVGHVNCTGPRACYDEGKRAAEALCFDFIRAGRVDARVARIFNTYGPRMRADDGRIVSNLLVLALADRSMTIHGDGEQTRSFCYVSDLVEGLIRLMEVEPAPDGAVNIGNPAEISILDLAAMVRDLVPGAAPICFLPRPQDDPSRRKPDISRARRLLRWEPKIPLAEGLRLTAAWFRMETRASRPAPAPRGPALTARLR